MSDINQVVLSGSLQVTDKGAPRISYTKSGKPVISFTLITAYKEFKTYHNIVWWSEPDGLLDLPNGSRVKVEGRIGTRMWEKDGQKHYRTEITAQKVEFEKVESGNKPVDIDDVPF